jgi:hypothetical protein
MLVLIAANSCQPVVSRWPHHRNLPSTQYAHKMCARLTLPHAAHLVSAVMSFSPLPAMNRWRFLRYDVFFLGTAFKTPSQISLSDGKDGNHMDGIANAANGVGSVRKGCERRCRNGVSRIGRVGPLRAGSSVCHSGGSGRASAIVSRMHQERGSVRACGLSSCDRRWCWNNLAPQSKLQRAFPHSL